MENSVFIDTGAYLARFCRRDAHNQKAIGIWQFLRGENYPLLTTNHVLDELATLLARRTSYAFSAMKLMEIYESATRIERTFKDDELQALNYFRKFADHRISYTDCLSFVVMEKLAIHRVFTFDRHFRYAGFEVVS